MLYCIVAVIVNVGAHAQTLYRGDVSPVLLNLGAVWCMHGMEEGSTFLLYMYLWTIHLAVIELLVLVDW